MNNIARPPLPLLDAETATLKARRAEDAWNMRDPNRVALAYTAVSAWQNRAAIFQGREASINDLSIAASERRFLWQPWSPRPDHHPGLTELGL